jgi:hypothetical protein
MVHHALRHPKVVNRRCCLGWKVGGQAKNGVVRVAVLFRFEKQTRGVRKGPFLLRETY